MSSEQNEAYPMQEVTAGGRNVLSLLTLAFIAEAFEVVHMSPLVQTLEFNELILKLACLICLAPIRRLIIIDDRQPLISVTSFQILVSA